MNSMGFTVRSRRNPRHSRLSSGRRPSINSRTFVQALSQSFFMLLVVLVKIHTRVKACDLIVTVKHPRPDVLAENADPKPIFRRLAVGRMVDLRVYVRVKAIRLGPRDVPGRWWLLFHQADLRKRLRALVTVLPW